MQTITRYQRTYTRQDGSQARITAQAAAMPWDRSIDVQVHRRANPSAPWHLCSDQPAPGWKQMSRAEYLAHGRSEVFQTVTTGELLKCSSMIGKPMSALEG